MLKNPVDNFIPKKYPQGDVIQFFGESPELYSKAVCYPNIGCLHGHNGWDIVRPYGTQIYAVEGGTVVEAQNVGTGYGQSIRVLTPTNREWVYAHLSATQCKLGDVVEAGQPIVKMGNSGFVVSGSTPYWKDNPYAGTHLHLGKRTVLPYSGTGQWNITYSNGLKGVIQNYDNGYFGSIDYSPSDFEGFTPPTKPKYKFLKNLEYGMTDPDIAVLQRILHYENLLPDSLPVTSYYGDRTADALKRYQLANGLITQWHAFRYGGKYCYEITRAHLNAKYG